MPLAPRPARERFVVEGLGASLQLPAGAVGRVEPVGNQMTAVVVDGSNPPVWSMRIQPMRSALDTPTPRKQVDHLVQSWESSGKAFRVVDERELAIDGRPAIAVWFRHPVTAEAGATPTPATGEAGASGWYVVQLDEREFLVFVVNCLEARLAEVRPAIDAALATATLHSPTEVLATRDLAVERAEAFLGTLTPDRLRGACGEPEFLRMYRPNPAGQGETEVGWMRIEVREGARGELNPMRDPAKYAPEEREPGLLVLIQGRAIADAQRGIFLDTDARYWLAWDQSEENWSIRATHRQGDAHRSEAETGVRSPRTVHDPRGTLMVVTRSMSGVTNDDLVWPVPDGYLSQALRWVLGRVLPRTSREPHVYNWYHYDSRLTSLPLRVDRWEPAAEGKWLLKSQPRENAPEVVSVYDADGTLVRRITAEGVISEPADPETLRRRWRALGLETD